MKVYLCFSFCKMLTMLLLAALIGCSKTNSKHRADSSSVTSQPYSLHNVMSQAAPTQKHTTTIKATFLKDSNNRTAGDFTNVKFYIENYSQNTLLSDSIECQDTGSEISCKAVTDLNQLKPAIYRLVIKSGEGLLGSDVFEIIPNLIPVVITIDNESTGYYLIQLITHQTGFRESEIYQRVSHILSISQSQEYDLEITLYDLFMYYGGSRNLAKALDNLSDKLRKDVPVSIEGQDGISGSMKPIY